MSGVKKMNIIIPLGGIGERFKKHGYKKPKALIKVFGKPILHYLLDNLKLEDVENVCIPYNNEYSFYNFEDTLIHNYPNITFKFIKLENNTEGAAETINIGLKTLGGASDNPVLCLDGDNFYTTDIISLWDSKNRIFTFDDLTDTSIYSYVNIRENRIIDIVEKEKISNNACSGAYGFSSSKQLLQYTQKILDNKIKQKGEYYTSTVIREMIKDGVIFDNLNINIQNYHCLGLPIQLRYFYNSYPRISSIDNKCNIPIQRICFDLDNTLVSYPKVKQDYSSVEPIQNNINFLKYLKSFGHTIIIYTARRMKTHGGNVGKCLCDIGKITFDTLTKFDIPFDEIYFGKPYADVYIDDLALNCYDNLEKELGYYIDKIAPRDFNTLELSSIETYKKKSEDLSGEIYYYKNIPYEIKDLFPIFIDYDIHNKWYVVEKINGITLSSLYVNELLTENTLIHVMNTIKRIQSVTIDATTVPNNLNIYSNYAAKLKNRYESYDYTQFKNHKEIFESLFIELTSYEMSRNGKCVVIHGDTVMTNILINNLNKIKIIDMRGKLGNDLTIYGDFLYDWAKLYQSLIGYDKVMSNKTISLTYESTMIKCFQKYFIEFYSEKYFETLKIIVKSLLFTLIPLHDNVLCLKYYELINCV
jgi:capsule biosynthesis phosphatase